MASYRSVEELRDRKVSQSVRLRDIATVKYEEPDVNYRARFNSRPAVALHVLKESEANTRETCLLVEAELKKIQANRAQLQKRILKLQKKSLDDALKILTKEQLKKLEGTLKNLSADDFNI